MAPLFSISHGNGRFLSAKRARAALFPAPAWNGVLRSWHGGLRAGRSDRTVRFANVRRRTETPNDSSPGRDRVCGLSEADTRQDRHELWNELWNPFLKNSGDWDLRRS